MHEIRTWQTLAHARFRAGVLITGPDSRVSGSLSLCPGRCGDCDGGTCWDDFGWRGEGRIPPDGAFRVTARVRCPDDDPLTLVARSKVGEDGPEICDVAPVACSPEPQTLTEWHGCGAAEHGIRLPARGRARAIRLPETPAGPPRSVCTGSGQLPVRAPCPEKVEPVRSRDT